MDDLTKLLINHNNKNLIDLEDTSSSDCNDKEACRVDGKVALKKNTILEDDLNILKKLDE